MYHMVIVDFESRVSDPAQWSCSKTRKEGERDREQASSMPSNCCWWKNISQYFFILL